MRFPFVRRVLFSLCLLLGMTLNAQILQNPVPFPMGPFPMPTAGDSWYGQTTNMALGYFHMGGTYPFYKLDDAAITTPMAPSPGPYPLSMTAGYHNASMYVRSLLVSNVVRQSTVMLLRAKNKKEGLDPLVGKGPASLSFWQWLKLGEMALKTYGKISSIVKALESGAVNIDIWKLCPKVAVLNEDDPFAPALIFGLVPSSKGAISMAKEILNFNDPRFYGGNLVKFDDLDRLVPSLAVKPSFYGAYAHMVMSDPESRNADLMQRVMRNFHELRTGLSMINRRMIGRVHSEKDIPRSRFSTAWAGQTMAQMQRRADFWTDAFFELKRGARFYGPQYVEAVGKTEGRFASLVAAEQSELQKAVEVKAADTWQAKSIAAALANISIPLETDEYQQGVKKVQDMVNTYASDSDYELTHGIFNHQNILLGLAVADAWTNKLVHDELRALRQIYSIQVQREGQKQLAPFLVKAYEELQDASRRLGKLQSLLTSLQSGQSATTNAFFSGDDIARVATRMDTDPNALP